MEKSEKPAMVSTVATINNSQIVVIENGEKKVAIKPICDALGVAYQGQIEKLKQDEILSSTVMPSMMVGADGKQREMQTIPFMFVFGWLFTINPKNVAPESKEAVIRYKKECYIALYEHFTELDDYLKYRTEISENIWEEVEEARDGFKFARTRLEALKTQFANARALTLADYKEQKSQMSIDFSAQSPQQSERALS